MNMKKTLSLLMGVAVVVSAVAAIALAIDDKPDGRGPIPPPPPGHRGGFGGPAMDGPDQAGLMERILRKLDLTDKQKQQIKGIVEANREGLKQAIEARAAAIKAFGQAMEAGEEAGIRTAATVLGNAVADVAVIRIQTVAAIKAVLTPDQLKQLEKMKERAKGLLEQQAVRGSLNSLDKLGPKQPRLGKPVSDRPKKPGKSDCLDLLANEKVFKKIDSNGDGAITLREIKAFQKQQAKDQPLQRDK